MGRPSKLTEAQWAEIKQRMIAGETAASLSREFGVSKAAIGVRVNKRIETVRTVAKDLVAAEVNLRALPISEQLIAITLADELRTISTHLAGAAKFGAATAHRLAGIANAKVQEVDDASPLTSESMESLKGIAVLTKMANDASSIPLNLLAANKETVSRLNDQLPGEEAPVRPQVTREEWLESHGLG